MERFENKAVFITGASSGIGEELARQLVKQGAQVFLFARREDRLKKIANEIDSTQKKVGWMVGDVSSRSDLDRAVKTMVGTFGRIDIVVANAGFGVAGNVSTLSAEDYERQFAVNVFGVLHTLYSVESELEKSKGQLILIGSVAGYVPLPGNSAYTMSKFCVRALSGALQHEWKEKGITVTHLAPGFVDSDIRRTDNLGQLKADHPDPIPSWLRVPTEKAVSEMLSAIYKKKKQRVITGHGKVILLVNQYLPQLIPWLVSRGGVRARPEPK